MKYSTSIILLSIIQLINAAAVKPPPSSATKCSQSVLDAYDQDMAKLMTIGYRIWPESYQESKPFCIESRQLYDKINNYKNRCSVGSAKEFSAVIFYSIQRAHKTYCPKQPNKKVINFFKAQACTNRATNHTLKCMNKFIEQLQGISRAAVSKQIPHACCEYFEMIKCFEIEYEKVPNCSESAEIFINFVRQIFDDIVNLSCTDYSETTDRCEQLGKPPAKDPKTKSVKSFILPLLDIWNQFDNQ